MSLGGLRGLGLEAELTVETLEYRTKKLERDARRKRSTEHVWIFIVTHRLTEKRARDMAGSALHLDTESIAVAGGPVCYRCEADGYTAEPCSGYREWVRSDESWGIK